MTRSRVYSFVNLLGCALVFFFRVTPVFASLCLNIDGGGLSDKSIPMTAGDQLRLHFRHSIYGGIIEESFTLREQGLQITELRYSEARLVEFYGHEQARRENDFWLVRPEPVIFPALSLRVSDAAAMKLFVQTKTKLVNLPVPPGSALRVSVSACKQGARG